MDLAYAAVTKPVEGTILTVSREAFRLLSTTIKPNRMPACGRCWRRWSKAAEASLERTPELLPILKKAGVVDSGGQGLVFILQGMLRLLNGEAVLDPGDGLTGEDARTSPQAGRRPWCRKMKRATATTCSF